MSEINNSVVHLTMRFDTTVLSTGTGVIYQQGSEYYIVTAWHNLTGLHSEKLTNLSSQGAIPNNVLATISINYKNCGSIRQSIRILLHDDQKSFFFIHPENWPRVDVAVIPFNPNEDHISEFYTGSGEQHKLKINLLKPMADGTPAEINAIQQFLVPDPKIIQEWFNTVSVTEELFIPGYPHNIHDYYLQPLWKRATIATSVQLGWNRESKFLIDTASKSGMSGSPVLFYSPNGHIKLQGNNFQYNHDIAILAGIYVGRLAVDESNDPQIGTVWHKSVIEEIIDAKCYENHPFDIQLSNDDLKKEAYKIMSTCSAKGIENINNDDLPSRYYVSQHLMKEIKGRASPERALEAVLDAAKDYDGPLIPDENN